MVCDPALCYKVVSAEDRALDVTLLLCLSSWLTYAPALSSKLQLLKIEPWTWVNQVCCFGHSSLLSLHWRMPKVWELPEQLPVKLCMVPYASQCSHGLSGISCGNQHDTQMQHLSPSEHLLQVCYLPTISVC